jgi:hypothetical protein
MEAQKTSISQGNIEQKEEHWRYHNTQLQTILQSCGNKTAWYWHKTNDEDHGTK